jgi:hypothetical protein
MPPVSYLRRGSKLDDDCYDMHHKRLTIDKFPGDARSPHVLCLPRRSISERGSLIPSAPFSLFAADTPAAIGFLRLTQPPLQLLVRAS